MVPEFVHPTYIALSIDVHKPVVLPIHSPKLKQFAR